MRAKKNFLFVVLLMSIVFFLVDFNVVLAEQKMYCACKYNYTVNIHNSGAGNVIFNIENGVNLFEMLIPTTVFHVEKEESGKKFEEDLKLEKEIPMTCEFCKDSLKQVIGAYIILENSNTKTELLDVVGCTPVVCKNKDDNFDDLNNCRDMKGLAYTIPEGGLTPSKSEFDVSEDNVKMNWSLKDGFNAKFKCFDGDCEFIKFDDSGMTDKINMTYDTKGREIGDYKARIGMKFADNWCAYGIYKDGLTSDLNFSIVETEETEETEEYEGVEFSTPDISGLKQLNVKSIPDLIGNIIKKLLGFVGTIALVMFVGGGLLWMTAMGNAERQKKAVNMILWSSLGVLVILSSYVIVSFVLRAFGV